MKTSKLTVGLALAALLLGASVSQSALAHGHGHGRSSVFLGFNFGFPGYYPAPYYYPPAYYPPAYYPYYPAPVVIQSPPQVYVEREAVSETQSYWYYCAATRGYYPYVRECPGGWQKVAPAPQN